MGMRSRLMGGGPGVWLKNTIVVIDPCLTRMGVTVM